MISMVALAVIALLSLHAESRPTGLQTSGTELNAGTNMLLAAPQPMMVPTPGPEDEEESGGSSSLAKWKIAVIVICCTIGIGLLAAATIFAEKRFRFFRKCRGAVIPEDAAEDYTPLTSQPGDS
eukprot:scaffold6279_cov418-Prasinococcus_capsulatus_cf.AAC.7